MIAKSTKEFQNNVLKKMTFTAYPKDNYILYTNCLLYTSDAADDTT